MTDMYDKPDLFEGKLDPYPHNELGVEVRRWNRFDSVSQASVAVASVVFVVGCEARADIAVSSILKQG
jgi:hypothetical protein